MGGEAVMVAMITSLKHKNRICKNHCPFKNNRCCYGRQKPEYDLPSTSPELLSQIKEKVKTQLGRCFKVNMFLFAISLMTVIVFFKCVI